MSEEKKPAKLVKILIKKCKCAVDFPKGYKDDEQVQRVQKIQNTLQQTGCISQEDYEYLQEATAKTLNALHDHVTKLFNKNKIGKQTG